MSIYVHACVSMCVCECVCGGGGGGACMHACVTERQTEF